MLRRTWIAFLLAGILCGLSLVGQEPSREDELEAIRGEIAQLQSRLSAVVARQGGIRGELEKTQVELELQEKKVAEAVAARQIAIDTARASAARVAELETKLGAIREQLRHSLVGLYRLGRHGYLRLFLALKPNESLLPGIRLLRLIAHRDAETLDRFRATRTRLEFERDELAAQQKEIDAWVAREQDRERGLERLRGRQAALLAQVEGEGRQLASRQGELRDKERKLSNLVDFLYGRQGTALAGRSMQDFKGALDWPVRGAVTAGFGPRLDPRYKTRVPHNGLDISAATGAEVRAIYPGKVLFAAPFEGFDQAVVVSHPGKVLTLCAGLNALSVKQDDVVSFNSVLGHAGERIYFEIRVDNRPEDPARWLR
jgi:septal ring factor EnvC (AmiA/AmiB activator)